MTVNQNPSAPKIMDPANQLGLYNPNAYVRGAAAEAIGKRNGAMRLRKAASEGGGPTDQIKDKATIDAIRRATGSVRSYASLELTHEEDAAFDDMIDENADRREGATDQFIHPHVQTGFDHPHTSEQPRYNSQPRWQASINRQL